MHLALCSLGTESLAGSPGPPRTLSIWLQSRLRIQGEVSRPSCSSFDALPGFLTLLRFLAQISFFIPVLGSSCLCLQVSLQGSGGPQPGASW